MQENKIRNIVNAYFNFCFEKETYLMSITGEGNRKFTDISF